MSTLTHNNCVFTKPASRTPDRGFCKTVCNHKITKNIPKYQILIKETFKFLYIKNNVATHCMRRDLFVNLALPCSQESLQSKDMTSSG